MTLRIIFAFVLAGVCVAGSLTSPLPACCPCPPPGMPVVNADQTVIILWDAANKTQHFIRKASFLSDAEDFGFIVPSPSRPELEESGNEAFPYLHELTKPEVKRGWRPIGLGCSAAPGLSGDLTANPCAAPPMVTVLLEKEVAGFNAVVLEARSSTALVAWLKGHGYAYSPEVETWAKPYIEGGWKFTALKIAKNRANPDKAVAAAALRISFKTDRPLFPYREPDPKHFADTLGAKRRMLRIYFLADARYGGELTRDHPWTGQVVWADKLTAPARKKLLDLLNLPANTGPATWWLTEFEDWWPYQAAPADLTFSRAPKQDKLHRSPIIYYVSSGWPTDVSIYAIAMALVLPPIMRRTRQR